MLSCGSNPRVDERVTDHVGDWIKATLLGRLVRMVEVELIHELIECDGEIRAPRLGQSSNFG
jgi:hypothetical protein